MFSSTTSARSPRSTTRRLGVLVGAGIATSFALTGVAHAHVSVQPASVPGGDFSVIAFRVPNESDSASTVAMKVLLPKNRPIGEVQTTATPGWTVTTKTRTLAKPIEVDGEKLDSVVAQVTWRATGSGIRPGQFQDFDLGLGTLPASGKLVFNAVQTYSDGTTVNWNEVSADESVEPEHPAPTLILTPAEAESATASAPSITTKSSADQRVETTPATAQADSGSDSAWPLLLAGAALVVSLLTALLVWRRGPSTPVVADAGSRQLEDSKV
jgi:uncharacterized protein YcnI